MNKKTTYVAQAGMIAAVYAAATLITLLALQGLAWGPVQFRISEAVCVLAVLTPAAVPGLTVGCIIANLMALAINGTGALGMFGVVATGLGEALVIYVLGLPLLSALKRFDVVKKAVAR